MKLVRRILSLSLVVLVCFSCPPAPAATTGTYTIAVIPSVPPVPTNAQWAPFVQRLEQETGIAFQLKLYETMAEFERDIVSPQAPDFIFAHALQLVVAHEAQGFQPLVRGDIPIRAVLFVPRDSPVKSVADLEGRKIAFVGSKNL